MGRVTQANPLANVQDTLTPTQKKLLEMLSDRNAHTSHELLTCLRDPLADTKCLRAHLYYLRLKIRSHGYEVRSERVVGTSYYRLVHLETIPTE